MTDEKGRKGHAHDGSSCTFDFGTGLVPAHRHVNPDGSVGGWVADTAYVSPTASIGPDVWVCDTARVFGEAELRGHVMVEEDSIVSGRAVLLDDVRVSGGRVFGCARLSGCVVAEGGAELGGGVVVGGHLTISGPGRIGS